MQSTTKMHKLFKTCILTNKIPQRKFCSPSVDSEEIKIPAPWGHIAGKWWGRTDQNPILCLHGHMDNAGVFNRLIPLLNNKLSFLAVDFSGHGFSSHVPRGFNYSIADFICQIGFIKNYFQWDKVSLMGHSMGATSSFVYSMANPANVNTVVCLDGPNFYSINDYLQESCRIVRGFAKYSKIDELQEENPVLYSLEEITDKLFVSYQKSIDYEHIHHIVERHAKPSNKIQGKYSISLDSRLKVGHSMYFSPQECPQFIDKMSSPIFIAYGSTMYEKKDTFLPIIEMLERNNEASGIGHTFQKINVDGPHHVHLNHPELIADSINQFLDKNHPSCT